MESAGAESGLDVVLDNRLVETNFADKKDFLTVFKAYVKRYFPLLKAFSVESSVNIV